VKLSDPVLRARLISVGYSPVDRVCYGHSAANPHVYLAERGGMQVFVKVWRSPTGMWTNRPVSRIEALKLAAEVRKTARLRAQNSGAER
jgi:hypothetical protein